MEITTSNFIDVPDKARALGCNPPSGLALLPRNFQDAETKADLLHESSVASVRILFRQNNILETPLELEDDRFSQISEKGFTEWIAPTIFVSFALLNQNPHILSLALGVMSNYLTDFFKGMPRIGRVKLNIVVETEDKTYKRIHYEGPVSGLEKLPDIAREASTNEREI